MHDIENDINKIQEKNKIYLEITTEYPKVVLMRNV